MRLVYCIFERSKTIYKLTYKIAFGLSYLLNRPMPDRIRYYKRFMLGGKG